VKQRLDFVVVGAQKSGTTTLFEYLRRHPEVYLPPGKEAPFFSDSKAFAGGWDEYVRHYFGSARHDLKWGTVTPQYMFGTLSRAPVEEVAALERPDRVVPERIAAHSPGARIVAILRDPVERAFSHYRMEVMREKEQRSFAEAVDDLLQQEQLERSRRHFDETTAYITNGEFGRILAPYVELFGRERVLVCFAADLAADPAGTIAKVAAFVGVDPAFRPPNLGERYRVAGSRRRVRRFDLYRVQERIAASRATRAAWRALPAVMRTRIDSGFKEAAYQVDVRNRTVEGGEENGAPAAAVERLRGHYAVDRETLRALTGTEPPW
jgi:hypothetical protein